MTKPPLGRRVRAWTIIGLLYAAILGMAAGSVPLLRSAFRAGVALDDRLMDLVWAGLLLAPLGFIARYFIRVRLKTGLWRGTPQQRQQERVQRGAQCSTRGGAATQNDWIKFVLKWASYSAMEPTCSTAQRVAGRAVLAMYALGVLAFAAFGVICIGAAFADDNTRTATLCFLGLGLLILIIPGMAVRSLVRGIRAGKLGASREDLDRMRTQRVAWRVRESQRPLRSKLAGTAFSIGIVAYWWLRVTVFHAHHRHESWIDPAMATPFLLYSIYVQFRRPKSAPAATANEGLQTDT